MKNEEITFIGFTSKYADDVIHDVVVDFDERVYRVEIVDQFGKMIEEPIEGRLRKSRLREYQEELEQLDLVSWPLLEESPTKSFPTVIENSVVLYIFDEEGSEFYTTGRENTDLVKLHKATEKIVNTSFGSYEYY